jgi:hypothetical protein
MKIVDFGMLDFLKPGIPSLQGLLLGFYFEKYDSDVEVHGTLIFLSCPQA